VETNGLGNEKQMGLGIKEGRQGNEKIKIPKRLTGESLTDYSSRLASIYSKHYNLHDRKIKGQFFTPKRVAIFMANLVSIAQHEIKVLDPGAGTGILVSSFCDIMKTSEQAGKGKIIIDAYENDSTLVPILRTVLQECQYELEKLGCDVEYRIYEQDFVLHNARYFKQSLGLWDNKSGRPSYDVIISNPPYYKINKNSPHSTAINKLIYGQPNIYALFMALSISLLRSGGEGIFITPRSFCSGLYYKKFREWLLDNITTNHIHIFESRKDIFDHDGVLQENIILKVTKCKQKNLSNKKNKISISVSRDKSFEDFRIFEVEFKDIVYYKNGDVFIRIPSSMLDVKILNVIDKLPNTLRDLGLEISTGPVIPFRNRKYLRKKFSGLNEAPLLWMHNVQEFNIVWPLKKNDKDEAILVSGKTKSILIQVKNYVLLRRFSSKEQKRRLYAGVMLKSNFKHHKYIGIENHINYIHRPNGMLSETEVFGIAAILNTTIVDRYFRVLNGNTQVNATDIRSMPFPSIKEIRRIGEIVKKQKPKIGHELDSLVGGILGLDSDLIKQLNEEDKNE